jgi:hypothetical protein
MDSVDAGVESQLYHALLLVECLAISLVMFDRVDPDPEWIVATESSAERT